MNTILSHARRMHLFNNNPVLSAFGIRVIEGSNEVLPEIFDEFSGINLKLFRWKLAFATIRKLRLPVTG